MNDLIVLPQAAPPAIRGLVADTWQELLAELLAECVPQDFFERTWLRDIAILTRRIDEMRVIVSGAHSYELYRLTQATAGADGVAANGAGKGNENGTGTGTGTSNAGSAAWTHDPDELVSIHALIGGLIGLDTLTLQDLSPVLARVLGLSYQQRGDIFGMLQAQMSSLMLERDRIVGRYHEWVAKKKEAAAPRITPRDIIEALGSSAQGSGDD